MKNEIEVERSVANSMHKVAFNDFKKYTKVIPDNRHPTSDIFFNHHHHQQLPICFRCLLRCKIHALWLYLLKNLYF